MVDPVLAPRELRTAYTEKLLVMPHTYQANSYKIAAPVSVGNRTKNIIKDRTQTFLFVNLNRLEKVDQQILHIWIEILARVPSAKLVLLAQPLEGMHAIREAVEKHPMAKVSQIVW